MHVTVLQHACHGHAACMSRSCSMHVTVMQHAWRVLEHACQSCSMHVMVMQHAWKILQHCMQYACEIHVILIYMVKLCTKHDCHVAYMYHT